MTRKVSGIVAYLLIIGLSGFCLYSVSLLNNVVEAMGGQIEQGNAKLAAPGNSYR